MIKNWRSTSLLHLAIFVISAFILIPISASAGPVKRIGIVFDGPSELNQRALSLYKKEIIAVTEGEFDVQLPTDKIIQADWSAASVRSAIDTLLSDHGVDILITLNDTTASGCVFHLNGCNYHVRISFRYFAHIDLCTCALHNLFQNSLYHLNISCIKSEDRALYLERDFNLSTYCLYY